MIVAVEGACVNRTRQPVSLESATCFSPLRGIAQLTFRGFPPSVDDSQPQSNSFAVTLLNTEGWTAPGRSGPKPFGAGLTAGPCF